MFHAPLRVDDAMNSRLNARPVLLLAFHILDFLF